MHVHSQNWSTYIAQHHMPCMQRSIDVVATLMMICPHAAAFGLIRTIHLHAFGYLVHVARTRIYAWLCMLAAVRIDCTHRVYMGC
jgi:hypothetical protein